MACDALDCVVYCSEASACNFLFLLGPCWTQISCSFSAIRWFPFYFSAFCTAFIFLFLLSSYGKSGTLLSLFMVRDCKMRILRSKTNPLPSSCSQWFSWGTYILPSVLALYYYFMPWAFLFHALLTWIGMLVNTFVCLEHRLIVAVCISSLAIAGWVCQHSCLFFLFWKCIRSYFAHFFPS